MPVSIGGSCKSEDCPDNSRVVSGIGPIAVMILGEWQSLHPPIFTRYFPLAICSSVYVFTIQSLTLYMCNASDVVQLT